eukprot:scaffold16579_cov93-Cylindrotheca_fusiformis.AAC.1
MWNKCYLLKKRGEEQEDGKNNADPVDEQQQPPGDKDALFVPDMSAAPKQPPRCIGNNGMEWNGFASTYWVCQMCGAG